ncbi:hypothetical protein [Verrucomicrobium spinosum]|uniref:hypothetical protein n=1 Tax=Verrucomicrobium spinosum TaxID=2736 RepID=UPI00277D0A87|nr:hypothetical protein [Verrucomicrobium spinosum]
MHAIRAAFHRPGHRLESHPGYERSVAIAREALATGASVYDLVLQKNWLTHEQLEDILKPENMTHPRQLPEAPPAADI